MKAKYQTIYAKGIDATQLIDPEKHGNMFRRFEKIDADNKHLYKQTVELWHRMLDDAKAIWGDGSAVHKYLRAHQPPKPPDVWREWRKINEALSKHEKEVERKERARIRREEKLERERQMAEARRAKRQDYRQRQIEARQELESQGYIAGEHYPKGQPIRFRQKVLVRLEDGSYAPRGLPSGEIEPVDTTDGFVEDLFPF